MLPSVAMAAPPRNVRQAAQQLTLPLNERSQRIIALPARRVSVQSVPDPMVLRYLSNQMQALPARQRVMLPGSVSRWPEDRPKKRR